MSEGLTAEQVRAIVREEIEAAERAKPRIADIMIKAFRDELTRPAYASERLPPPRKKGRIARGLEALGRWLRGQGL